MHGGKTGYLYALTGLGLLVGCADDPASGGSASASDSGITASASGTDTAASDSNGSDSNGSDSNGSGSDTAGTGSASDSATASGGTSASGSASDSDSAGTTTSGGPKFDVGEATTGAGTGGMEDCTCGSQLDFSYIWIANSTESTVTKLNTQTMVEEGRYPTEPNMAGSPSRTSVSISGLSVAVANRNGGIVKVWADPAMCDPMKNGQAGLQTSNDKNYLPWGQDDCVAWFTDFDYTTQRPVAWQQGVLDPITCTYQNERVWTAGCSTTKGDTYVTVSRLNGETGVIEDQVEATGFECSSLSPYGGAVDSKGNFWFTNLVPGNDRMAKVDSVTLDVTVWTQAEMPLTPYGMTVDSKDRVWLASWTGSGNASAARYDPLNNSWAVANNHVAYVMSGIQEDAEGRMWMNYWTYDGDGSNPGLTYVDSDTMVVGPAFGINCAASSCRGMSIDLDGNVWSTAQSMNTAFRFNPNTMQVDTYDQLVYPYTYSDMTGWAVQNATCGPEG